MFEKGVKLSVFSNFKIGGEADYFANVESVPEAVSIIEHWRKFSNDDSHVPKKIFILGSGTNILWDDSGFRGLVLKQGINNLEVNGNEITAGGGVLMSRLIDFAISKGLSGLEWAGGLPGTLGGAVCDNAGAFQGEMKDLIIEVLSLDIETGKIKARKNSECGFEYRKSIFKTTPSREMILEAKLKFAPREKHQIEEEVNSKILYRKTKHPIDYPNIGSIFKNVDLSLYPKLDRSPFAKMIKTDPFPVIPTGYLIGEAGLKGVSYGGAMISPRHSNFIVNVLNAGSSDVGNLIELAKEEVFRKFQIKLEEEVLISP